MADELKPPIILLGNFRSGTTLLQRLIGSHPDVATLYEPVGLWLYADPGRKDDEFGEADATARVRRYIRGRFLKLQRENCGRIIAEKTPHNILRIPYVRAIFPDAHFLYIVRNPLSYISSVELKWQTPASPKRLKKRILATPVSQLHRYVGRFLNQQWNNRILGRKYLSIWGPRYRGIHDDLKSGNRLTVIARQWARAVDKAERDLAGFPDGAVLKMRYEDFVRDPVTHMQQIFDHCGLTMTDDLALRVRNEVKADRTNKWQRFSDQDLALIIPEVAEQMTRLGYSVPATSS